MGRFGWTVARVKASHHQLQHAGVANVITVYASHGSISRALIKKILKDARIDEEEFAREL
jgi:predicted RNA binding protein YcfA (HicA-like mRNA interferase family)